MQTKGSPTGATKSFIILFAVALAGTLISSRLTNGLLSGRYGPSEYSGYQVTEHTPVVETTTPVQPPVVTAAPTPPVDTSDWKVYTNTQLGIAFKYDPTWKVLPAKKKDGFTVITIDPGTKFYNFEIFVGAGYYGLGSVPTEDVTIGGMPGLRAVGAELYGVTLGTRSYTFDPGSSLTLSDKFSALVSTVTFLN